MSEQNSNMNNPRAPVNGAHQNLKSGPIALHPVGTGLGAVGAGAAAGAVGGAIAGPVGMVAGAAAGAVVGALAGNAAAELVNPTVEERFWQESHSSRPYAMTDFGYDEFSPAYRYGWESFGRRGSDARSFDSVEADLARGWDRAKGNSRLGWAQAKMATKDAWNRVEQATRRHEAQI